MFTYNIWNTLCCIFCSPLGDALATEGALSTNHLPRNPHCSRQGRDLSWGGRPFFTTTEVTLLRGGWNLLITRIISVCVILELVLQLLMNEKPLIKTCQTSVQHPWGNLFKKNVILLLSMMSFQVKPVKIVSRFNIIITIVII